MSILLPSKLEFKEVKGNRATVTVEPCYPGYGVTIGNALRRVLLSSISGSAITSFKLKGVMHEFSSLPHVKEDAVGLALNIKKIRVKVFSDEPVVLTLKVKGEKTVTAGDIEKNSLVEIANPSQIIATLTDKSADMEMEFIAQKGYGYVTVEDRVKEKVDLGTIMVDALYTPLTKVGFDIDNIRLGERTDFERLVLQIETDGTVSPKDAMAEASDILLKHFSFVYENSAEQAPVKTSKAGKVKEEEGEEDADAESEDDDKKSKKRGRPKKAE
ncbi:MAG: DNA-directed RNA polymerase subunit alpha [Candidatus Komeilibacteria bacterium]|nr:DNA-directed RNA polymerase subunit alpha [Candidatus Komeilibacteria bacterium]